MKKLPVQIDELVSYLPKRGLSNEAVSHSTVGWQIEHSIKTINQICKAVSNSNPDSYKPKFDFRASFILWSGFIPRGKARAPKVTVPSKEQLAGDDELMLFAGKAKERFTELDQLNKNAYLEHPVLGHFNLKKSKRFMQVHTEHHLKIIRDIMKRN